MKNKIKVLIIDLEGTYRFTSAQLLCLAKNVEVHLIESSDSKNHPGLLCCIQHKVLSSSYSSQFLAEIEGLCIENSIDLLFPSSEKAMAFAIEYKKDISVFTGLPALPKIDSFKVANNKYQLSALLKENNIPQPMTWSIYSKPFGIEIPHLRFPVLIKPILDFSGGEGIKYISSENEMRNKLPLLMKINQKVILQEFIKSTDICISVYCENGKILAYTIQQALINSLSKFAPPLSVEFIDNEEVLSVATALMNSLEWSGIAHIDMIRENSTNKIFVIEINPRIWGSLLSSYFAGVNFPELMIHRALGRNFVFDGFKNIQHIRLENLKKILCGDLRLNSSINIFRLRTGLILKIKYLLENFHCRLKKLVL